MTDRFFEDLVAEALDSLPADIAAAIDNVEVVIEEEPRPEDLEGLPPGTTLLGLYRGVPLTARGLHPPALPDRVVIFRKPIVRAGHTPDGIRDQVRRTVVHEIAHHFGIDDERLRELGW